MKEIVLNNRATTVRLEKYSNQLPTEQDLAAFEKALGYTLPADYREFLLEYNGGVCELRNIIVSVRGYLCDLFGLYPDNVKTDRMNLRLPTSPELTELWGTLPPNLLPIGEVDSGDMIAIRFEENGAEIVIIDHEDEGLDIVYTAPSFFEFLSNTEREND